MHISEGRSITFRGVPAVLFVLRNNGDAWGRVRLVHDPLVQYDVSAPVEDGAAVDLYDEADVDALDVLEVAALCESCIAPAVGWLV